ncbi:MAG TPA: hypothetical protein VF796_01265 [Humisphaera sp.]
MDRPRVEVVAAALPPALDGIGDYAARFAAALAAHASVGVLAGCGPRPADPIPGVTVREVFSAADRRSVRSLGPAIAANRPDWVLLQYNPFSFGKWGLNWSLPTVLGRAVRRGQTRLAVMVHEAFVPCDRPKFAAMSLWQRPQLWRLGRAADVVFFSVGLWAERFRPWFPRARVEHLPVGSNVRRVPIDRDAARRRLGIHNGAAVLGMFGTGHASRLFHLAAAAAADLRRVGHDPVLLYVGPDVAAARATAGDLPLIADGAVPPDEVSRRFAAMDLYLSPLIDGVSTRRTTMMTALQHGVPTIGTHGSNTDPSLRAEDGRSMLLAAVGDDAGFVGRVRRALEDDRLRATIGRGGEALYAREFDWPRVVDRARRAMWLGADDGGPEPR